MRFNSKAFVKGSASSNPAFHWLAVGSGLNSGGMQGEQVIVGLLVYQLTGSSAWVGISLALFFAPMLLVGVPAGAMADRYERRTVLIQTELALTLSLATFAILLWFDLVSLTAALAISVFSGVLRSLHHPARLSYVGDIAGNSGLVSALSLLSVVTRFGQLLGALAAGTISEIFSPAHAYAALAAGHVIAMWCFFRTHANSSGGRVGEKTSGMDVGKPPSVADAIREYLRLLRGNTTVVLLIGFASLIEVFGFSFATAMPQIAVERLSLDAAGLGAMHAARAVGGLVGALLLSMLVIGALGRAYLVIFACFGLALLLLAIAPSLASVLFAIALVAVFASSADILVQGMLQLCVSEEVRGRAMGAWVVALGMGPLGHLQMGVLISLFGTAIALAVNAVVLLLIGVTALVFCSSLVTIRNAQSSMP